MQDDSNKKFWFVWNVEGHCPRHQHNTYQSAEAEAARLARMADVKEVYILEAVKRVVKVEAPVNITELEPYTEEELVAMEPTMVCERDNVPF